MSTIRPYLGIWKFEENQRIWMQVCDFSITMSQHWIIRKQNISFECWMFVIFMQNNPFNLTHYSRLLNEPSFKLIENNNSAPFREIRSGIRSFKRWNLHLNYLHWSCFYRCCWQHWIIPKIFSSLFVILPFKKIEVWNSFNP